MSLAQARRVAILGAQSEIASYPIYLKTHVRPTSGKVKFNEGIKTLLSCVMRQV
jgi:hypothetical protein